MAPPNPTMLKRRLGRELRRLREHAGLQLSHVAPQAGISAATLSRIERGGAIGDDPVRRLLDIYGLTEGDEREALLDLAKASNEPGWWVHDIDVLPSKFDTWVGLEADAATLRTFHLGAIDGLLQTEPYALAVIRAVRRHDQPADIQRQAAFRVQRQRVLHRQPPLTLRAVIDEATLRRHVGDPDVMAEQLAHLASTADMPNVTLRVVPYAAGAYPGLRGDFMIMEFLDSDVSPVGYTEGPTGIRYIESQRDVTRLAEMFDHVEAQALSAEETKRLISSIAEELQP